MRAPDLIAAIEWTRDRLKDFTVLEQGLQGVPLSAVNQSDEVGKQIVVAADEVVADAGSASDLIATVPEKHTGNLQSGMFSFSLPAPSPELTVSMLWRPRMDADMAHRWLRGCLLDVCTVQVTSCD